MLTAVLISTLLASGARPFSEERLLLDRRLETLRRLLPDGAKAPSDVAVLKELASRARFTSVEVIARQPTETGSRGEVVVDLTGYARFADVDFFFRQVAAHPRLVDVQSLAVSATNLEVVRVAAAMSMPYRPVRAPVPAPPEGLVERPKGVPRPQAEAFIHDQALALAKSEQVATLRRARRNPRVFLAELAAATRDRPVTLTFASVGEDFVVRGLSVGEGPTRALETRFESGFFRVSEFLMARHGGCRQFELRGKVPVAGAEAELPLPAEDPFDQDESPCRVERDPVGSPIWVRAGGGKAPARGSLSVHARDLDAADVFNIIHDASRLGLLVDGAVSGRYSLEMNRVSVDEALSSLRKVGLNVSESGRIRRVSLARTGGPPALEATGGPSSDFSVKRSDARDLLAVMAEMDPSLAALGPPGPLGRVSLWAVNQPLFDLRGSLLDAVGLSERSSDDGHRILFRKGDPAGQAVPVAGTSSEPRLVLRPQDLTLLEFELSALSTDGARWTAWAYSPTGHLFAYRSGDRLADCVVKNVDAEEVVLETDEGPMRLSLPPPTR